MTQACTSASEVDMKDMYMRGMEYGITAHSFWYLVDKKWLGTIIFALSLFVYVYFIVWTTLNSLMPSGANMCQ